ncbi:MAG: hypothetical protein H6Q00_2849 [Holophagaceae bacterium]|nr:hypothetical protein [Holophagaceae bacterium]
MQQNHVAVWIWWFRVHHGLLLWELGVLGGGGVDLIYLCKFIDDHLDFFRSLRNLLTRTETMKRWSCGVQLTCPRFVLFSLYLGNGAVQLKFLTIHGADFHGLDPVLDRDLRRKPLVAGCGPGVQVKTYQKKLILPEGLRAEAGPGVSDSSGFSSAFMGDGWQPSGLGKRYSSLDSRTLVSSDLVAAERVKPRWELDNKKLV